MLKPSDAPSGFATSTSPEKDKHNENPLTHNPSHRDIDSRRTVGCTAQNHRQLQPNEHETNLPGATTIDAPPAGFDPINASDEDLAWHGFPPRPDQNANPDGYARWAKAMSASKTRIVPHLEQTGIFHNGKEAAAATAHGKASTPPPHDNAVSSPVMSGIYNLSGATSYGPSSFYYIENDFVVPIARQAPGCTGSWDFASAWAGLDGWGAGYREVLQAGVEFDAYCSGATTSAYYAAWFEWYPYGEVRIVGFPVAPGNDVFVEVWHTSATQGYAYMVNINTKQAVQIGFTAYPGYPLVGSSAEWIVEDQVIGGTSVNFGAIPFWNGAAYTMVGTYYNVAIGTQINEVYGASLIAQPSVIGPQAFVDYWY